MSADSRPASRQATPYHFPLSEALAKLPGPQGERFAIAIEQANECNAQPS